jgi:hypothetical protein
MGGVRTWLLRWPGRASTVWTWRSVTIAVVTMALCAACAQAPSRPDPGIRDKIDRDAGLGRCCMV